VIPYGTMSAVELTLTDIMSKIVVDDWASARPGSSGTARARRGGQADAGGPACGTRADRRRAAARQGEARRRPPRPGQQDNPLVLIEAGEIYSSANFHTPAMALAFDALAIAMTYVATASAYRSIKLMTGRLTGLPDYLTPVGGASAGFLEVVEPGRAEFGELDQVSVRVADRGDARLGAEFGRRPSSHAQCGAVSPCRSPASGSPSTSR
jgi:Aromatic amino acid lyase